jgi:isochorismate synthase EntC
MALMFFGQSIKEMNSHLLNYDKQVENIVKLLLEKLAYNEPPFLSEINENELIVGGQNIQLSQDVHHIEDFIRKEFNIPVIQLEWKDIRKQSLKNYLLFRFSKDKKHLLSIHLDFAGKRIATDSIVMEPDEFKISRLD